VLAVVILETTIQSSLQVIIRDYCRKNCVRQSALQGLYARLAYFYF